MSPSGPKAELRVLKKFVTTLERRFLTPYLPVGRLEAPAPDETLNVGAYIVLTHGALENFVEGLALWVLSKVVKKWTISKKATRSTASALLYQPVPPLDNPDITTIYDNLRESLNAANQSLSQTIQENNGITPRHLHVLFYPLGVDVPSDPLLIASLESVISMRHYWAHQYRYGASVVKSAADAKLAVGDCLVFAERLAREAVNARP